MADGYNITITVDFHSTGDGSAKAAVAGVGAAAKTAGDNLVRTGNVIETAAQRPLQDFAKAADKATGQTRNWGMAANAMSYQMQDFTVQVGGGTSAITAFAQQAPQLIGGLQMAGILAGKAGLAMTGVAMALPLVMFGGRALFNWIKSESGETAEQILKVQKTKFEKAHKFYGDLAKKATDDRLKEARAEADELKKILGRIDSKTKSDNKITNLSTERENAKTSVKIIQTRIDLEVIESALVTATGDAALRLAQDRLDKIQRIADLEQKIKVNTDASAITQGETTLAGSQQKFDSLKGKDQKSADALQQVIRTIAGLREKAESMRAPLAAEATMIRKQILELEAKSNSLAERNPGASLNANTRYAEIMRDLADQISTLKDQLKPLDEKLKEPQGLDAKADSMEDLKKVLEDESRAASKALSDAARDLSQAAQNLSETRQTQATEKTVGDATSISKKTTDLSKPVTDSARKALNIGGSYKQNTGAPGYDTAKDRIRSLIEDNKPDAEQGKDLIEMLQQLQDELKNKDQPAVQAIQGLISLLTPQTKAWEDLQRSLGTQGELTLTAINGVSTVTNGLIDRLKTAENGIKDLQNKANQQR